MADRPSIIFKYQGFNPQSIKNLNTHQLYFGPPANFNDPFDCAIPSPIAEPTPEESARLMEHLRKIPSMGSHIEAMKASGSENHLPQVLVDSVKHAISQNRADFKDIGVACFSECNNNSLMWAHYGDSCRGFCLGFDTSNSPFHLLRQVRYVDQPQHINIEKMTIEGPIDVVDGLFRTKSKDWEYEREWRVINQKVEALAYDPNSLRSIYFGLEAKDADIMDAREILMRFNPDTEFFRLQRNSTNFDVRFISMK